MPGPVTQVAGDTPSRAQWAEVDVNVSSVPRGSQPAAAPNQLALVTHCPSGPAHRGPYRGPRRPVGGPGRQHSRSP